MSEQGPEVSRLSSVDDLRQLLVRLQSPAPPYRLGERALSALGLMLDTPRQTAVSSITELAKAAHADPSTLTRLAQRLGFRGFKELQDVFRDHVTVADGFYSGLAARLQTASPNQELFKRAVEDEWKNLAEMLRDSDAGTLGETAAVLAEAKRVRVFGLRQFFSIASFIAYGLGMLRKDVALLAESQHGVAHALAQMSANDALVVIGCAPYTRATVAAARLAREHGLTVIAITDSHASPLAAAAHQLFLFRTEGTFYSNCMASAVVLVEGLLTLVAQRMGDRALNALKRHEALIRELNVQL